MVSWSVCKVVHWSLCSVGHGRLHCQIILSFKSIESFFFISSLIGDITSNIQETLNMKTYWSPLHRLTLVCSLKSNFRVFSQIFIEKRTWKCEKQYLYRQLEGLDPTMTKNQAKTVLLKFGFSGNLDENFSKRVQVSCGNWPKSPPLLDVNRSYRPKKKSFLHT